jgi:geranylgeranyl diphosphate synthase type II
LFFGRCSMRCPTANPAIGSTLRCANIRRGRGKALRPALCLSAGRVFCANGHDLLGLAVAIELLHNAFLVHDDIVDGSEMRRGRPTLSATHGMAAALNAGDALAIVAGQVMRRAARRLGRDLADLV